MEEVIKIKIVYSTELWVTLLNNCFWVCKNLIEKVVMTFWTFYWNRRLFIGLTDVRLWIKSWTRLNQVQVFIPSLQFLAIHWVFLPQVFRQKILYAIHISFSVLDISPSSLAHFNFLFLERNNNNNNNNNNLENTWATYQETMKSRNYRKQPYWALHTYFGKY